MGLCSGVASGYQDQDFFVHCSLFTVRLPAFNQSLLLMLKSCCVQILHVNAESVYRDYSLCMFARLITLLYFL